MFHLRELEDLGAAATKGNFEPCCNTTLTDLSTCCCLIIPPRSNLTNQTAMTCLDRSRGTFLSALCVLLLVSSAAGKLKVYIHAGQSNMEGQGSINHLEALIANPATAPRYLHLVDEKGDWVVRDDVYCRYNEDERQGKLTTGFGFRTHAFGPELEFGHMVGNVHEETVFIIKATWGGSSLAADFRPPSSGAPEHDYELLGDDGTPASAINETYGHRYRQMMALLKDTLDNIEDVIPEYDGSGYEILGFLWFQGFSDVIDKRKLDEYQVNLQNLFPDVRKDLGLPDLPITIGELGQQGTEPNAHHTRMREMQRNVTDRTENAKFAEISPYMVVNPTDGFDYDGKGNFHYNGRADNFFEIGRVFAETALSFYKDYEPLDGQRMRMPGSTKDREEAPVEEEESEDTGSSSR